MTDRCTLRSSPRTIHQVRRHLEIAAAAIVTWCGRRGLPYEPGPSAWLTCQKCLKAQRDHQLQEGAENR